MASISKSVSYPWIRVDLPFGLATGLDERGEETFAVRAVAEDCLAALPAIDDVLDRTGIFEAQLQQHDEKRV
jgi:hypothetical protein